MPFLSWFSEGQLNPNVYVFPSVLFPVQTPHSPSTTCVWLQHQLRTGMTWDSMLVVWVFLLLCVMRSWPVLPTRQRKRKRRHYFSTTYTHCQWPRGRVLQEHCTTERRRQHCKLSRSSSKAHQLVSHLTEISVCVCICGLFVGVTTGM